MRLSQNFTKTQKFAPSDEPSKNAQLLLRASYIHKEMAGVYALLPLGLRVVSKINTIIREEMDALGAQELQMTVLQNPEAWHKSGRFDDEVVDVWFKTKLKNDSALGLGFTHEEPITNLMKPFLASYRDLPRAVYQIQTKFRNETRAKSGVLRGREFLMKDMYSFNLNEHEHQKFYERAKQAYTNVFERLGIGRKTYLTFASGGSFAKYSHEFQTEVAAGEDTIYYSSEKNIAINQEVLNNEVLSDLGLKREDLEEKTTSEVGNIFTLGTKFSDALGLQYRDESSEPKSVFMGSYGIGPTRLMGVITEMFADDKGLVWPDAVAPYSVYLVSAARSSEGLEAAEKLYLELQSNGIEVLFDDRETASIGEKLADSELLGIPRRVVVSDKSLAAGGVGYKLRVSETPEEIVSISDVVTHLKSQSIRR